MREDVGGSRRVGVFEGREGKGEHSVRGWKTVGLAAAAVSASCILFVSALGRRGGETVPGLGLLQTRLAMYPVDASAVKAYLKHQGHEGALGLHYSHTQGASPHSAAGQKRALSSHSSMVRLHRKHVETSAMWVVPTDQSQKLSEDTDDLDGSTSVVHGEPLEDPTMKPENQYIVEGTSFPTRVSVVQPTEYSFDGAKEAPPSPTPADSASAPPAVDKKTKCEGAVRWGDSEDCVSKKALAQALQSEKDVQLDNSRTRWVKKQTTQTRDWEEERSDSLDKHLVSAFRKAAHEVRTRQRALDTTDRKIHNGDDISMQKIEQFQAQEVHDMQSVLDRVEALEEEVEVIPHMTGPPGVRGPRGSRGPQGARGIQGPRGPFGDEGPPGDPGARGVDGEGGLSGHRGPAGHYVHLYKDAKGTNEKNSRNFQVLYPYLCRFDLRYTTPQKRCASHSRCVHTF